MRRLRYAADAICRLLHAAFDFAFQRRYADHVAAMLMHFRDAELMRQPLRLMIRHEISDGRCRCRPDAVRGYAMMPLILMLYFADMPAA